MAEGVQHRSFCRICNAMCGVIVTVGTDGRVEQVRGDPDHQLSRGYTCPKGRAIPAMHHDPRRLDRPLVGRGEERRGAGWDEVLDDLGARLSDTLDSRGPDSVAMYLASGSAFDSAGRRAAVRRWILSTEPSVGTFTMRPPFRRAAAASWPTIAW